MHLAGYFELHLVLAFYMLVESMVVNARDVMLIHPLLQFLVTAGRFQRVGKLSEDGSIRFRSMKGSRCPPLVS